MKKKRKIVFFSFLKILFFLFKIKKKSFYDYGSFSQVIHVGRVMNRGGEEEEKVSNFIFVI